MCMRWLLSFHQEVACPIRFFFVDGRGHMTMLYFKFEGRGAFCDSPGRNSRLSLSQEGKVGHFLRGTLQSSASSRKIHPPLSPQAPGTQR